MAKQEKIPDSILMSVSERRYYLFKRPDETIARLLEMGASPFSIMETAFHKEAGTGAVQILERLDWAIQTLHHFDKVQGLHQLILKFTENKNGKQHPAIIDKVMTIARMGKDSDMNQIRNIFEKNLQLIHAHPPDEFLTKKVFEDILSRKHANLYYGWREVSRLAFQYADSDVQDHIADMISKKTSRLINHRLTLEDPVDYENQIKFQQWRDFLLWVTLSGDLPHDTAHKTGVKNLLEVLKVSEDYFIEDVSVRYYHSKDEAIVNMLFELCQQRNLLSNTKAEDFCGWITTQHAKDSDLREDKWSTRMEEMVRNVLNTADHNGNTINDIYAVKSIFSDLFSMVQKASRNGKYADTDWPLRIARIIYDASNKFADASGKENPIGFDQIISIRNACNGNTETDNWFMVSVLLEAIKVERKHGPLKPPTTMEMFSSLRTLELRPFFLMAGPRNFSVSKNYKNAEPLWEIGLRALGASEASITCIKVASDSLSVDFTKEENLELARNTLANEDAAYQDTHVDLTGILDDDHFGHIA